MSALNNEAKQQASEHLGQFSQYPTRYSPDVLVSIKRQPLREGLKASAAGIDRWTAYELSWLSPSGAPMMAVAEFDIDAHSPCLIESKSLKLYLNGFNHEVVASLMALHAMLVRDLSACVEYPVTVRLYPLHEFKPLAISGYTCIDNEATHCQVYQPDASLLSPVSSSRQTDSCIYHKQRWCSHVFRSLCPVTAQPDWASVFIDIEASHINSEQLLQYLASFRQHQGFHEQCVERIYHDIWQQLKPKALTVFARFMRRGGLDINPYRSSDPKFHQAPACASLTSVIRQ